jgi:hypothetical protein
MRLQSTKTAQQIVVPDRTSHTDQEEIPVAVDDRTKIIRQRVSQFYWEHDRNCATTALSILSEIFGIELHSQTIDSALAMHGAGKYGAQCGLVEGALMFMGIWGRHKRREDRLVIDACRDFAGKFEARFGSLLCRELRPQGFGRENPPHLCEGITCEAIEFAALYIENLQQAAMNSDSVNRDGTMTASS